MHAVYARTDTFHSSLLQSDSMSRYLILLLNLTLTGAGDSVCMHHADCIVCSCMRATAEL